MHIAERHASDVKGMLQSMAHDFSSNRGVELYRKTFIVGDGGKRAWLV